LLSPPSSLTSFPLQLETGVEVTVERNGDQFVVADSSYEVAKVLLLLFFLRFLQNKRPFMHAPE
jgi:hypothetical protein